MNKVAPYFSSLSANPFLLSAQNRLLSFKNHVQTQQRVEGGRCSYQMARSTSFLSRAMDMWQLDRQTNREKEKTSKTPSWCTTGLSAFFPSRIRGFSTRSNDAVSLSKGGNQYRMTMPGHETSGASAHICQL